MKKLIVSLLLSATVILAAAGCGKQQPVSEEGEITAVEETAVTGEAEENTEAKPEVENIEETSGPVSFTDALGRQVTVESPKKVAVLLGSFADVWTLAGGEVAVTVKDAWTSFDLGLSETTVNVGSFMEPDLEKLFEAEPDFIIASAGTSAQVELLDTFETSGVPFAYFEVSDFDDYLNMLGICTRITGNTENYEKYGTAVAASIEDIREKSKQDLDAKLAGGEEAPTVLFIRAAASSVKAKGSEGTVGGEILADLGAINIADGDRALLDDLSLEAIVAADPDYIFVTTQGEDKEAALSNVADLLSNNPAWSELSAVKSGRYFEIEKELYNSKPNARWGEAYEKLANILYGE